MDGSRVKDMRSSAWFPISYLCGLVWMVLVLKCMWHRAPLSLSYWPLKAGYAIGLMYQMVDYFFVEHKTFIIVAESLKFLPQAVLGFSYMKMLS